VTTRLGWGSGATATAAIATRIQTLSWDAENRLIGVSENGATFVYNYDGDGKRITSGTLPVNGSFEEDNPPAGWTAYGVTLSSDSSKVKIGSKSIKVDSLYANRYAVQSISSANMSLLQGKTVTFGAWVWCNSANRALLVIEDSDGYSRSSYHPGDSQWRWLSVSFTPYTLAMNVYLRMDTAYFDGALLVEGSSITPTTADNCVNTTFVNQYYEKNTTTNGENN
jgi:YD repeat-containing protein